MIQIERWVNDWYIIWSGDDFWSLDQGTAEEIGQLLGGN
jgi:hypothetical protein